jgi:hypothetical protein
LRVSIGPAFPWECGSLPSTGADRLRSGSSSIATRGVPEPERGRPPDSVVPPVARRSRGATRDVESRGFVSRARVFDDDEHELAVPSPRSTGEGSGPVRRSGNTGSQPMCRRRCVRLPAGGPRTFWGFRPLRRRHIHLSAAHTNHDVCLARNHPVSGRWAGKWVPATLFHEPTARGKRLQDVRILVRAIARWTGSLRPVTSRKPNPHLNPARHSVG